MDNYAASFSLVVISCIMCVSLMYIYGKYPESCLEASSGVASQDVGRLHFVLFRSYVMNKLGSDWHSQSELGRVFHSPTKPFTGSQDYQDFFLLSAV